MAGSNEGGASAAGRRRAISGEDRWTAVDDYFNDALVPSDAALDAALEACVAADLPPISVTPSQGKLLNLLARIQGAYRVLEIGTLGAYSTIWLARALPEGGRVVTLEMEPGHAAVARANLARAGLTDVVDVRVGRALDTLPALQAERQAPFDLVFIDADKANTAEYFSWALDLTRPGSLVIVDNVVRGGAVVEDEARGADVVGIRRFVERLASEPRATATFMQTVGEKGYDGLVIALVT